MNVFEKLFATEATIFLFGMLLAFFGSQVDDDDVGIAGGMCIILSILAAVVTLIAWIWA